MYVTLLTWYDHDTCILSTYVCMYNGKTYNAIAGELEKKWPNRVAS